MKFIALIIFILLGSLTASAGVQAQGTEILIYRDGLKPKSIEVENYKERIAIRSKPPHRQLNPEGKTSEFEGVSINEFLKLTKRDQNSLIHFIGIDGYISTVPASVLLKTKAILALTENGQPLVDRQGGIQVIYPTEGNEAVESSYAKKAAFWCWYVRSIVVGDLPNDLKIGNKKSNASIEGSEAFSFEGPSVFQFQKTLCPKTFRVPLSKITQSKVVSLHLLSGNTKEIPSADYDLILTSGKKAIPVNCGGPFALIDRAKSASLTPPVLAKDITTSVVFIEVRR